ncbi:unnamed protein product [Cylindrotheca closterium]|uniref:Uncharacterized protein n=1 Tax=Cylindrotheca closterium TaxID=2856 RepID=A0AAD2FXG1_9STRA|nr:unnamed protein product [Cylindrotheca closterium]
MDKGAAELSENILWLPFSGIIALYTVIVAAGISAWNHGTFQYQGPANANADYAPIVFVSTAVLALLYSFYYMQGYVTFSEYFRLQKLFEAKILNEPPLLTDLKYGTKRNENPAILCADRCAGNLLEQLIPFFVSMFAYATFVDAGGAARIAWAWFAFRMFYPFAYKRFPLLFASTIPSYCYVWYMMGHAAYSAAMME